MHAMLEIAVSALGASAAGMPFVFHGIVPKAIRRLACFACNLRNNPFGGVPGSGAGLGVPFGGGGTTFQDDGSRTDYDDHGRAATTLPPSAADRTDVLFSTPPDPARVSVGRNIGIEGMNSQESVEPAPRRP